MISPAEYNKMHYQDENLVSKVIAGIDIKLREMPLFNWAEAVISGEYDSSLRDEVAKRYIDHGWFAVAHRTSSENGERAGLTEFVLLTEDTFHKWYNDHYVKHERYHLITKNK